MGLEFAHSAQYRYIFARSADRMAVHRFLNLRIIALAIILLIGIFLRLPPTLFVERAPLHFLESLHPQPGFKGVGFDENLYREYVNTLSQAGLTSYPDLAEGYVNLQTRLPTAILPPTRFLYIFCAYLWHQTTGADALAALKNVSSLFGILTLVLAAFFATRLGGFRRGPLHDCLDGFCANPDPHDATCTDRRCLCFFCARLPLVALGKFAATERLAVARRIWNRRVSFSSSPKKMRYLPTFGLLVALAASYWFRIGRVTRFFWGNTTRSVLGCHHSGESMRFARHHDPHLSILVSKAAVLPYAIKTGDGPWYRYFVDLSFVSPIVSCWLSAPSLR